MSNVARSAVAGCLVLLGACERSSQESPDARVLARSIKARLAVPMQVDGSTRLDDVRGLAKDELGYFLTLTDVSKAELASSSIGARLEAEVRGNACQDADYKTLLGAGITLRMTYQTRDGAEAARIAITPKDCGL